MLQWICLNGDLRVAISDCPPPLGGGPPGRGGETPSGNFFSKMFGDVKNNVADISG